MFERSEVEARIKDSISVKSRLLENRELTDFVFKMGQTCLEALKKKKKIIFAGNGGSYSDSIHLAAEFVARLRFDRPALAAIALGSNNSNLTAIGNDYGYEYVFEREIAALGQEGDVFIAITTSGNSPNILKAAETAKKNGLTVIGWTGQSGGKLSELTECFKAPSKETARVQECHILVGHIICEIVESTLFSHLKPHS